MLSRRQTIQLMGMTAAGLLQPLGWSQQPATENPLRIPAMDSGELQDNERRFQLNLQSGRTEFMPGVQTSTFGINGSYLGPVLRFRRYERVSLQVNNRLGEDSTLHWHGMHLPPTADGGPHQVIADGESWNSRYQVLQYGGTYWYHSHMLHTAGAQVNKGLAGMIIVDDEELPADLPSEYGVDDIPIILQDRRFDREGEFEYLNRYEDIVMGQMGDTILTNGTLNAQFRPRTELVRFRLLNGANARTFNIAFSDNREFLQIGSDGGLLEAPVPMQSLRLAAGERAEILVAFTPGESVNMVSLGRPVPPVSNPGAMNRMLAVINSEAFNLLALHCESSLEDRHPLPARLATVYRLPQAAATNVRQFRLAMGSGMRSGEDRGPGAGPRNGTGGGFGGGNYFINGRVMTMDFINERIPLNTTEIWEIRNSSPMMHPFHVHNGQFQVLDRNGNPPPPGEMGWKDTVQVGGGGTVRIIMRFTDYTDEDNPYMYHCHILEHEDRGMMGQFVLV